MKVYYLGHWLATAEINVRELLSLFKERDFATSEGPSHRIQEAIHALEEAHQYLIEASKSYDHQRGIPADFRRIDKEVESSGLLVYCIMAAIFGLITYLLRSRYAIEWFSRINEDLEALRIAWGMGLIELSLGLLAGFWITWKINVVVHEGLHAIVLRLITGKMPKFIRARGAYGPVFEDVLNRRQGALALLTPVVVITTLGVILLRQLDLPILELFVFAALVLNTAGSLGDLAAILQLFKAGPKALLTAWAIYTPPLEQEKA